MPGRLIINPKHLDCRWEVPAPNEGPGLRRPPDELRATPLNLKTRTKLERAMASGGEIMMGRIGRHSVIQHATRFLVIRRDGDRFALVSSSGGPGRSSIVQRGVIR